MVGTGRFELPTPRTPSECSTRLSHVPTGSNWRSNGLAFTILHQSAHGKSARLTSLTRRVTQSQLNGGAPRAKQRSACCGNYGRTTGEKHGACQSSGDIQKGWRELEPLQ